jgi:hypothetical protein
MSDRPKQTITIWFFVGVLFLVYGVLILGAGIYGLFVPPDVAMRHLHLSIWWGALLLAVGAFYGLRFRPRREAAGGQPTPTPGESDTPNPR